MGQEKEKERKREIYLIMLKMWEKLGEMVVKNRLPKMVELLVAKVFENKNCFSSKEMFVLIKLWRSKNYVWALLESGRQ